MEAIIHFLKTLLYSALVLIGIIIPSNTSEVVPPKIIQPVLGIASTTSSSTQVVLPAIPKKIDIIIEPKKITAPITKPLVSQTDKPVVINRILSETDIKNKSILSPERIVLLTNIERAKYSLPPLVWNDKLAIAANMKAKDMIAKQYFAHESPDGIGIEQLAKATNYNYSLIGENLAMGDFISSEDVVEGWMNSKGHRENILKPTFKEIGVSAIIGLGDGRNVWYSVQEFGRPPPSCLLPDTNLESIIKSSNLNSKEIGIELSKIKSNIESGSFGMADIKSFIEQYNILVNKSNILQAKIKELVTVYNTAVKAYNECVATESSIVGA